MPMMWPLSLGLGMGSGRSVAARNMPRQWVTNVGDVSSKPTTGYDIDRGHPQVQHCVHWWPMVEGSGTIVRDYVGKNNGTLTNFTAASAWGAGRDGLAPNFDGVDSKIIFSSSHTASFTAGASFLWRSKRSSAASAMAVFGLSSQGGFNYFRFNGSGEINGETSTNADNFNFGLLADDTRHHHYAIVFSGTACVMFQDGRPMVVIDGVVTASSIIVDQLGARAASTDPYGGLLDDVRIYNRALSQHEITDIYLNPWAPFVGWGNFLFNE